MRNYEQHPRARPSSNGNVEGIYQLTPQCLAASGSAAAFDIRAFRIPADQFIALAHGTWHAGPYFSEPRRNFYNLELTDTNKADFTVCHLQAPVAFVG
jgi:hypothetical protein